MNDKPAIVAETLNCDIILGPLGFYARCRTCPWVSEEIHHAKYKAVAEAARHDGTDCDVPQGPAWFRTVPVTQINIGDVFDGERVVKPFTANYYVIAEIGWRGENGAVHTTVTAVGGVVLHFRSLHDRLRVAVLSDAVTVARLAELGILVARPGEQG